MCRTSSPRLGSLCRRIIGARRPRPRRPTINPPGPSSLPIPSHPQFCPASLTPPRPSSPSNLLCPPSLSGPGLPENTPVSALQEANHCTRRPKTSVSISAPLFAAGTRARASHVDYHFEDRGVVLISSNKYEVVLALVCGRWIWLLDAPSRVNKKGAGLTCGRSLVVSEIDRHIASRSPPPKAKRGTESDPGNRHCATDSHIFSRSLNPPIKLVGDSTASSILLQRGLHLPPRAQYLPPFPSLTHHGLSSPSTPPRTRKKIRHRRAEGTVPDGLMNRYDGYIHRNGATTILSCVDACVSGP